MKRMTLDRLLDTVQKGDSRLLICNSGETSSRGNEHFR